MDRNHPSLQNLSLKKDQWGRGKFISFPADHPAPLSELPLKFRRFGLSRTLLESELEDNGPYDFALLQTGMTYWYPGTQEVIEIIRETSPGTRIIIGGVYATLCPGHARSLGADLTLSGLGLEPLWQELEIEPDLDSPPFWEGYPQLSAGVIKLTEGCPYRCTYCSVSTVYKGFSINNLNYSVESLKRALQQGAENIAFYDDALLFRWEDALKPFLETLEGLGEAPVFHTPNALNARMINRENSEMIVKSGFRTFYLGFESVSREWQGRTGEKVSSDNLARAVDFLVNAGGSTEGITVYIIIGHPDDAGQEVEASIRFAGGLGVRVMLSEFSPIPGTPDGERSRKWVNMEEPLQHNKTFFTGRILGRKRTQELKQLCKEQNRGVRKGLT